MTSIAEIVAERYKQHREREKVTPEAWRCLTTNVYILCSNGGRALSIMESEKGDYLRITSIFSRSSVSLRLDKQYCEVTGTLYRYNPIRPDREDVTETTYTISPLGHYIKLIKNESDDRANALMTPAQVAEDTLRSYLELD